MTEPNNDDEQASYKFATQAVDDAMRWDILGPKVVEVLVNYAPAKEHIDGIVLKSLQKDSDVKAEVETISLNQLATDKGHQALDTYVDGRVEKAAKDRGWKNKNFWVPTIIATIAAVAAIAALFKPGN
jgi:hypothetical protein